LELYCFLTSITSTISLELIKNHIQCGYLNSRFSLNRIENSIVDEARFFIKCERKSFKAPESVGIKYSIRDVIYDIISTVFEGAIIGWPKKVSHYQTI